jgi:hypothetical protein
MHSSTARAAPSSPVRTNLRARSSSVGRILLRRRA